MSRITIVPRIYYPSVDQSLTYIDLPFVIPEEKVSGEREQPYHRYQFAEETPRPVDYGWVDNPRLLIIHNGDVDQWLTLLIGDEAVTGIPPQGLIYLFPNGAHYLIKAQTGRVRFLVDAVP